MCVGSLTVYKETNYLHAYQDHAAHVHVRVCDTLCVCVNICVTRHQKG